jgi:hypothetical protein
VVAGFVQWPLPLLNPAAAFVSEWVQSFYYIELIRFLMYKTLFSPNILLVVSIVLGYVLEGLGFDYLEEVFFSFLRNSAGVQPDSYSKGTKVLSPDVKWPGHEGGHSPGI